MKKEESKNIIEKSDGAWICAEIGANHQGDLDTCRRLFSEAKKSGADAVKLQKRDNSTLFTKTAFNKPYENSNSYGATYGEHREALEFDEDQYKELIAFADYIGITFFATAFDIPSVDFLEKLNMPMYKVASADLNNMLLIDRIYETGKPMIISTGGSTFEDIDRVYLKYCDKTDLTLLHCVATYPNQSKDLNLRSIESMKTRYPKATIGYSNHHPRVSMNLIASALGAEVIEVHFTLNRANKGTDNAFSLEPQGLALLCNDVKEIPLALGSGEKNPSEAERSAIVKMGKSIYPKHSLEKGHKITADDVILASPGSDGIPPYKFNEVVGSITLTDLSTGVAITEDDIDG